MIVLKVIRVPTCVPREKASKRECDGEVSRERRHMGRTGETSLSHGCFVPVSTLCHKCVSVMSHGLSPISALSQPGHSNSLTLSQGCHTHGTVTFRDVFETPVRQMFTPAV